jgi:hypothetical protein
MIFVFQFVLCNAGKGVGVYSRPQIAGDDLLVIGVILPKIDSLFQFIKGTNQLLKRAIDDGQRFVNFSLRAFVSSASMARAIICHTE